MNTVELLKEFAKLHNIDKKEVNKFLNQHNNPKTIDDLVKLPHDMLEHINYISYVKEPLQSFIADQMVKDRYETVDLDDVLEALEWYAEALDEDDEEGLNYVKEVEEQLVKIKFGSVVYDW